MRWVFTQPDSALSVTEAFVEVDQAFYGLGHEKYITRPWQGDLVKTEMNLIMDNICAVLYDELVVAFDE
jgi:hypothetical protein